MNKPAWRLLLPEPHTIDYINPVFGSRAPVGDVDLLLLGLRTGVIEVQWDSDHREYVTSLYRGNFDEMLCRTRDADFNNTVNTIQSFAAKANSSSEIFSASDPQTDRFDIEFPFSFPPTFQCLSHA